MYNGSLSYPNETSKVWNSLRRYVPMDEKPSAGPALAAKLTTYFAGKCKGEGCSFGNNGDRVTYSVGEGGLKLLTSLMNGN